MKIIIPAAGAGTRLRPHTHTTPKALVQVAGKPILGHILDRLSPTDRDSETVLDVAELILIIGYMGEKIKNYLEKGEKMKAVEIDGWYGCGKPESLLATNRYLLQKQSNHYNLPLIRSRALVLADFIVFLTTFCC